MLDDSLEWCSFGGLQLQEEARKRIREQINNDRTEVATRAPSQASRANELPFGGRVTNFKDAGVDLNSGGG